MISAHSYPHLVGSIDRAASSAISSIEGLDTGDDEKQATFSGTAVRILHSV